MPPMPDPALDRASRLRSLGAVIVAMGVTSAIYSLSFPLFAARLDEMGEGDAVIGINAAAQAISLLAVAPLAPRLLRRWGPAVFMLWMLAASFGLLLLAPLVEDAWYWLALRLLLGGATGLLWIAGEAWINQATDDARRGRTLALYGISGAGGTMAGFGVLYLGGHTGWLPFLILEAMIVVCAAIVAWAARDAPPFAEATGQKLAGLLRAAPESFLVNLLVALTFGALATFMPVYLPELGLERETSFLLLTVLCAGGLLQYPIGWLADRVSRRRLVLAIMAVMAALFAVMPGALADPVWRWPHIVLLGVGLMALYTLALILLGGRFRGGDLGSATTVFQVVWNVGMAAGPFAVGFAMDAAGNRALPWTLLACHAAFAVLVALCGTFTRRGSLVTSPPSSARPRQRTRNAP